ncbi:MAG: murein biosynthesis integral membrane protein MurJ [Ruminococcaceae bacterium]|nr:murein biosynthesis integral membrane protein MurJ [Oscillospiraceae bacterium]
MNEHKIAKTAVIVLIINILSRGLALIANSFITSKIGVNDLTGAYSYALTLSNILTTIIGTTLTTSVLPIYTDLRENHTTDRANGFINNTISLTVIVSLVIILIVNMLAPFISRLAGNAATPYGAFAIRILIISVMFIALYYIFSSLLQANNKFYLAAMVSLPSSIVSILYLVFFSSEWGIYGLTFVTLLGFFLQAAFLVPSLKATAFKFKLSFSYKNEDMFKIFRVVAPVIVGVCAYQINMLTNGSIAFSYDPERYIVLNNAQNLGIQIIMTLVLAVSSVIYPKLSELSAKGNKEDFKTQLTTTLSSIILLLIPLSFAFYMFSYEIMDLIYGYGKFTKEYLLLGSDVFKMYSFAFLGIGFKEICDRAFYSLNNTRTSAYNGVVIMAVNIILSFILVKPLGLPGIAVAYSIASLTGGINILILFRIKNNRLEIKKLISAFFKSLIACIIMAAAVYFIKGIDFGDGKINLILKLLLSGAVGVIVYALSLLVLKTKEINILLKRGN